MKFQDLNNFEKKRNLLKQIGFTYNYFIEAKEGLHGSGEKLLAYVIEFTDIEHFENIIENKDIKTHPEIPLVENDFEYIEKKFEYKKTNIKRWKKETLINRLRFIYYIPKCLVSFIEGFLLSLDVLKNSLFHPVEKVCNQCYYRPHCLGAKCKFDGDCPS